MRHYTTDIIDEVNGIVTDEMLEARDAQYEYDDAGTYSSTVTHSLSQAAMCDTSHMGTSIKDQFRSIIFLGWKAGKQ